MSNTAPATLKTTISEAAQDLAVEAMAKLYSHVGVAQAREYPANAVDEHRQCREAGIDVPPVLVTFSSVDGKAPEGMLVVRDFGRGMDYDTLVRVYVHYDASGKVKIKSVAGSFGIGAKAAFSVGTTLVVRSRTESGTTLRLVMQYRPGDGIHSAISDVTDTDPLDSTGTEVRVRIPEEHVNTTAAYLMVAEETLLGELELALDTDWLRGNSQRILHEGNSPYLTTKTAKMLVAENLIAALDQEDDTEQARVLSREVSRRTGTTVTVLPTRVDKFREHAISTTWGVTVKGIAYSSDPVIGGRYNYLIDAESVLLNIPRNREVAHLDNEGAASLAETVRGAVKQIITELGTEGYPLAQDIGLDRVAALSVIRGMVSSYETVFPTTEPIAGFMFRLTWGDGGLFDSEKPLSRNFYAPKKHEGARLPTPTEQRSLLGTDHVILGLRNAHDVKNGPKLASAASKARKGFDSWATGMFLPGMNSPEPGEAVGTVVCRSRTCTTILTEDTGAAAVRFAVVFPEVNPERIHVADFAKVTGTELVPRKPRPVREPGEKKVATYAGYRFTWRELISSPRLLGAISSARRDSQRICRSLAEVGIGECVDYTADGWDGITGSKIIIPTHRPIPAKNSLPYRGVAPSDGRILPYLRDYMGVGEDQALYLLFADTLPGGDRYKVAYRTYPEALDKAMVALERDRRTVKTVQQRLTSVQRIWSNIEDNFGDMGKAPAEIGKYLRRSGSEAVYSSWDTYRELWHLSVEIDRYRKFIGARAESRMDVTHGLMSLPTFARNAYADDTEKFTSFRSQRDEQRDVTTERVQKAAAWIDYVAEQCLVFDTARGAVGEPLYTHMMSKATERSRAAVSDAEEIISSLAARHGEPSGE